MAKSVFLHAKTDYESGQVDAVDYCKRFGEHMLAVKIVSWRKGKVDRVEFINGLEELITENGDILVAISPQGR